MSGRREQAAKVLARLRGYEWADLPETGRAAARQQADAVLAALGDADTAQADAWDEAHDQFCVQLRIGLRQPRCAHANPYRAVVGDRAAAEGRDT